jgi:hypothetical protein
MRVTSSKDPRKGKIKPSNEAVNVTMDDVISFDDALTLFIHRFYSNGGAEEVLDYYQKNKNLFFGNTENIYISKNILDYLPNKKNDH